MPQSTEMDEIPEEAFLMVTQEHWEDKVVDIPVAPSPQFSGVGGAWGRSNVDGTATEDTGLQTSLFPIDNYDLIYRRWEDDVIFPDNSVVNMPQPILPQIDPNDPNFIIGIPVEPPPVVSGDKDGRKVKGRVGYKEWWVARRGVGCREGCMGVGCREGCMGVGCREGCMGVGCREGCMGIGCREGCMGVGCREGCMGVGCREGCMGVSCREGCMGVGCKEGCMGVGCREGCMGVSFREGCMGVGCREGCMGVSCREG